MCCGVVLANSRCAPAPASCCSLAAVAHPLLATPEANLRHTARVSFALVLSTCGITHPPSPASPDYRHHAGNAVHLFRPPLGPHPSHPPVHPQTTILVMMYGEWGAKRYGKKGFKKVDCLDHWTARLRFLKVG